MNAGPRSSQAYDDLKRLLLSGTITPGERLDPARLANDLVSGVTPIREALLRLAGERLVEIRLNTGFHLPVMTETILIDLYRLNFELLRLGHAVPGSRDPALPMDWPGASHADGAAGLFIAIADSSQRPELLAQLVMINDRLASARAAESLLFDDVVEELKSINDTRHDDRKAFTRTIRAYHHKRITNARRLVSLIYNTD
ncbi:GntR family transcriptional regulator [Novosphingobium sp. ZW T3_23]|uniref:GntR family transcriptional regulator n=1 Tax=Novosphingobium sp. ZW T3_23 TaxID=3378084 RepID=UPI00385447D5